MQDIFTHTVIGLARKPLPNFKYVHRLVGKLKCPNCTLSSKAQHENWSNRGQTKLSKFGSWKGGDLEIFSGGHIYLLDQTLRLLKVSFCWAERPLYDSGDCSREASILNTSWTLDWMNFELTHTHIILCTRAQGSKFIDWSHLAQNWLSTNHGWLQFESGVYIVEDAVSRGYCLRAATAWERRLIEQIR